MTNAALQVAQVQVLDPATGETVAGLRGLDVQQAEFNLRERAVRLGAVKVSEAALLTRLKKNGHLNLLDLITLPAPPTNASPKAAAPGAAPPPWTATVDDFTIEQTAVSFEDLTRRTPFKTELKPIEVSLKRFTTGPDSDASYSFRVASEAAEAFEGAGTVSINPIRSAGEVKVSAVDVKKYLPYAEDFFRGKIIAGKIEARVPYRFALGTNGLLAGVTNLSVKLTDLEVQLPESAETVTHVAEIGFERVDASLEDRRGRVGLFKGNGGSVLVRRQKDGSINLLGLLAVSRTNAAGARRTSRRQPAAAPTNASAFALGGWTLNVDEIQLDNYTFKVEDLVPPKPASFLLDQLALNLKGASTVSNTPVTANASFRLNETGTIAARGHREDRAAVRRPGRGRHQPRPPRRAAVCRAVRSAGHRERRVDHRRQGPLPDQRPRRASAHVRGRRAPDELRHHRPGRVQGVRALGRSDRERHRGRARAEPLQDRRDPPRAPEGQPAHRRGSPAEPVADFEARTAPPRTAPPHCTRRRQRDQFPCRPVSRAARHPDAGAGVVGLHRRIRAAARRGRHRGSQRHDQGTFLRPELARRG